ncbi:MAG: RsmB/NOP family class I SAM-dependent RNA methyltransferase [Magnetococcales bacterium]|nr:RsmB/NOP family class I SAM-dependent RNA methyltransferase [Magnetococcales bacterium]
MTSADALAWAGKLLAAILHNEQPADRVLSRFFREHPQLGKRDRNQVGDLVFGVLRHKRLLEHLAQSETLVDLAAAVQGGALVSVSALDDPHPSPTPAVATPAVFDADASADIPPGSDSVVASQAPPLSVADSDFSSLKPWLRYSLPDWLWQGFVAQLGEAEAMGLAASLNQPAPVDLRVNLLKISRDQVLGELEAAGLAPLPTPHSPEGIRLASRYPLGGLSVYQSGGVEVQDEGSQLVGFLVDPQPGETIVDLCAGGGGKSLHLASLMQGKGRILACDRDSRRLKALKPRLKRSGIRIIRTQPLRHERDPCLRPYTLKAHRVLVDAPCSGTGTLRRHPEIKWRLTPDQVEAFHARQCALLGAGAALVRPGGRLVYATCSLLSRENDQVAAAFLKEHPQFRLLDASRILAAEGIQGLSSSEPYLNLLPHRSGSDGFFVAVFNRL